MEIKQQHKSIINVRCRLEAVNSFVQIFVESYAKERSQGQIKVVMTGGNC